MIGMDVCDFDTPVWELGLGLYNSIVYLHKRFAFGNVKAKLNWTGLENYRL
jgi:hypothetical protein